MLRCTLYSLCLMAVVIMAAGTPFAQNSEPSLSEQQRALAEAREQSEQARIRGDALRRQAEAATNEADRISSQAAALAARIQAAEADIQASRARIAIVERLQRQQRARLAEKQGPILRLTAALQMMTRKPTALTLVEPRSLDEIVYVRSLMSAIMPEIEQRTASLRREVEQGEKLQAQADQAIASLNDSQKRLADRRVQLASLEASERISASQLNSDAGLEEERALALGEEARDILDLMDQIRESGEVREALAALDGPTLRPEQGEDTGIARPTSRSNVANAYQLPVFGDIITGLGEISASGYRSRGLTIAVQPNVQIVAPAQGRIAFAGRYRGYDTIVIIEHEQGWTSLITNMAMTSVEVGDIVVQGAPLGRSGSEEPTVTVELRRNGRPIDIAALIG